MVKTANITELIFQNFHIKRMQNVSDTSVFDIINEMYEMRFT